MAEKLSKKLNALLSEQDRNIVDSLFNFSDAFEKCCNTSNCTPEEREAIANKELNITYLIEQIVNIKNKHISNEKKKDEIHDLLKDVDIDYILDEVKEEIEKVKKLLREKAKAATIDLENGYKSIEGKLTEYIDNNIGTVAASLELAEKNQKEMVKREKSGNREETQMIEYEGTGFWAKFNKIREQGEKETGKKTGFFKSLFGATKEYLTENREIKEQREAEVTTDTEKSQNGERERIDNEIKKLKENIRELKKQKGALQDKLGGNFKGYCDKAMEWLKNIYNEVTEPIPEEEITEERVSGIFEKISEFRENRKEARHENKINKLKEKIEDKTEEIKEISEDMKGISEERKQLEGSSKRKDELYLEDLNEYMDEDIKRLNKLQKQRYDLARKFQKENEKYSSRNQGMDR